MGKFNHLVRSIVKRVTPFLLNIIIILTVFFTLVWGFKYKRWESDRIIIDDAIGYYGYLPAGIIFHDLDFRFRNELPKEIVQKKLWRKTSPINRSVLKMTMGPAICWLPFFAIGHIYASISDTYDNHGYSTPYYFMIFIAAIFYLWLGLFYLRKLLLLFFNQISVAIVLVVIVFATNLLYYIAIEPGMSHVYSFSMISMFIYFSLKGLKTPDIRHAIILGLLLGLITLIRPSNLLISIFPALIFAFDHGSFKSKTGFLKAHFLKILLVGVFMFIIILPQLIYWKIFTGQWVYYSYESETFYFNNPHIMDGLFSYRKGWFVYTPIMILSIFGLYYLRFYNKRLILPIIFFSLANFYVIFSWWCWWYAGSYGSRPLIDTYAIYAIPLTAFVQHLIKNNNWKRVIVGGLFIFFIYLNTFQIRQYSVALLHYSSMTKAAYWEIIFKMQFPENYNKLIQKPDYKSAMEGKEEQHEEPK